MRLLLSVAMQPLKGKRAKHSFGRALWLEGIVFCCRSSWLLFYGIEAFAIYKVLKEYPDDAEKAVSVALC